MKKSIRPFSSDEPIVCTGHKCSNMVTFNESTTFSNLLLHLEVPLFSCIPCKKMLWYTSALDYKHVSGTNYACKPRFYCTSKKNTAGEGGHLTPPVQNALELAVLYKEMVTSLHTTFTAHCFKKRNTEIDTSKRLKKTNFFTCLRGGVRLPSPELDTDYGTRIQPSQ